MRLPSRFLSALINFLLGVAWAMVLIGASTAFFLYRETGIVSLLIHIVLYATLGIFLVVWMESLLEGFRRSEELRRQGRLLEQIARTLEKRSSEQ